jgi:hypothetical protein
MRVPVLSADQLVAGVVIDRPHQLVPHRGPRPEPRLFEILGDAATHPARGQFVVARGPSVEGDTTVTEPIARSYFLPRVPGIPRAWIVDIRWTDRDDTAVQAMEAP